MEELKKTKVCSYCKIEKPLEEFDICRKNKDDSVNVKSVAKFIDSRTKIKLEKVRKDMLKKTKKSSKKSIKSITKKTREKFQ